MNNKTKLSKLKLTSSNRENKQISNFFSGSNENEEVNVRNNRNSIETKAKLLQNSENILLLSDDEEPANQQTEIKIFQETNKSEDVRKTVVSKFFDQSLDDFEVFETKLSSKKSLKERLVKPKKLTKKRKKQTSIKTAFAKNEEIFTELMAQHSIAENFNPEEQQIALACSISEAETNSVVTNCVLKEPVACTTVNTNEIRERLQQYGFKTGSNNEDYDIKYFLPKRRGRSRWANKFTSLTLRCPEKQRRKFDEKVEKFMNYQFTETEICDESPFEFKISSSYLSSLIPEIDTIKYFQKCLYMHKENDDIEIFYVTELFEPSKTKPGSLLRNFKSIPGRDVSPEKLTKNKMDTAYKENISNIYKIEKYIKCKNNSNVDELESKILVQKFKNKADDEVNSPDVKDNNDLMRTNSTLYSPECKRLKMDTILFEEEVICNEFNRAESPDIFAISDEDLNINNDCDIIQCIEGDVKNSLEDSRNKKNLGLKENVKKSTKIMSPNTSTEGEMMLVYEKFSSDEVKISEQIDLLKLPNQSKFYSPEKADKIVDLTQNDDSLIGSEKENEELLYNSFTIIASDDEMNYSCINRITNEESIERKPNANQMSRTNKTTADYLHITPFNIMMTNNDYEIQLLNKNESSLTTYNQSTPINLDKNKVEFNRKSRFMLPNKSGSSRFLTNTKSFTTKESPPLTQGNDSNESCIILSDDEINYSIINSDKKKAKNTKRKLNETLKQFNVCKTIMEIDLEPEINRNIQEISLIDFVTEEFDREIIKDDLTNDSHLILLKDTSCNASDLQLTPIRSLNSFSKDNIDGKICKTPLALSTKTNENSSIGSHIIDADETFDLKKLRKKYGISSSKKTSINIQKSPNCKKSLSESFLCHEIGNTNVQRFSSFSKYNSPDEQKQDKLFTASKRTKSEIEYEIDNVIYDSPVKHQRTQFSNFDKCYNKSDEQKQENNFITSPKKGQSEMEFEDFDEFDKLIYGSPAKCSVTIKEQPKDFERLLTARINEISPIKCKTDNSFEFENDERVYLIRTQNVPAKPDYNMMDSPTRTKELHKFGLKPLKRKQALTILEYIYNQTHPIVSAKSNSNTENIFSQKWLQNDDSSNTNFTENCNANLNYASVSHNHFTLKDCFWEELCHYEDKFTFAKEDFYIFQTNVSKKISMALLPFHVAWYNLIKSNLKLRESVLHFEPIDLQEIYTFLKSIGYRYEPKDIKKFFDKKCVIFRYDLGNNKTNRHLRKTKSAY